MYLLKFWQARRSDNGPADRGKTDSKPAGNIRTTGGFIVEVCINFQLNWPAAELGVLPSFPYQLHSLPTLSMNEDPIEKGQLDN